MRWKNKKFIAIGSKTVVGKSINASRITPTSKGTEKEEYFDKNINDKEYKKMPPFTNTKY